MAFLKFWGIPSWNIQTSYDVQTLILVFVHHMMSGFNVLWNIPCPIRKCFNECPIRKCFHGTSRHHMMYKLWFWYLYIIWFNVLWNIPCPIRKCFDEAFLGVSLSLQVSKSSDKASQFCVAMFEHETSTQIGEGLTCTQNVCVRR